MDQSSSAIPLFLGRRSRELAPGVWTVLLFSLGHFFIDLYSGAMGIFQPYLVEKLGLSLTQAGWLGGFLVFNTSVTQLGWGYLSDRYRSRLFSALAPAVAGLFLAGLGRAGSFEMALLLVLLGGAGVSAFHPQGSSWATAGLKSERPFWMAVFISSGTLGFALSPAFFSAWIAGFGFEGTVWAAVGGVAATGLMLVYVRPPEPSGAARGMDLASLRAVWKPLTILYMAVFVRSAVQVTYGQFLALYSTRERGIPSARRPGFSPFTWRRRGWWNSWRTAVGKAWGAAGDHGVVSLLRPLDGGLFPRSGLVGDCEPYRRRVDPALHNSRECRCGPRPCAAKRRNGLGAYDGLRLGHGGAALHSSDRLDLRPDLASCRALVTAHLARRRLFSDPFAAAGDGPVRKAVCLLSGGLDSATSLACARRAGFRTYALSFNYGQRHQVEIEAARRVAASLGAEEHKVATIDLRLFGGSALTAEIEVPKGRDTSSMAEGIPITYVPARNTIFLSFALAYAEVLGSTDVYLGVNAIDYSGYPDCRPEYVAAFQRVADLATRAGVEGGARFQIHTPLIALSKAEIIRLGTGLGVDFALTHSCYDPPSPGISCGRVTLVFFVWKDLPRQG